MPSNNHLSTTSLLSLLILLCPTFIYSERTLLPENADCVARPLTPLNGRMRIVGGFIGHAYCADPSYDVALNSADKLGSFTCSAGDETSPVLPFNWQPECIPKRTPLDISLKLRVMYYLRDCGVDGDVDMVSYQFKEKMTKYMTPDGSVCGCENLTCQIEANANCKHNPYRETDLDKQQSEVEMEMTLTTYYDESKPLGFYEEKLREVRKCAGLDVDNSMTNTTRKMWTIEEDMVKLEYVSVSSFEGLCDEHEDSVGTNLEMDGVLTCRGCGMNHYMKDKMCLPCDYNSYSPPFSGSCKKCPKQRFWRKDEKAKWLSICWVRS